MILIISSAVGLNQRLIAAAFLLEIAPVTRIEDVIESKRREKS